MTKPSVRQSAKDKILGAAVTAIKTKGYAATSVEDLCAAAGVTKGAFFHHFSSKEELAVEAANHWAATTNNYFESAAYHDHLDPLDRVLGYIDFRKSILTGELHDFTCLFGTLVQETYSTHPLIREAARRAIYDHATAVETDIAEAMRVHGITGRWSAKSLALHTQAVLQGAFILAKASGGPSVAVEITDHLRRYVELLFGRCNSIELKKRARKGVPTGRRRTPMPTRFGQSGHPEHP